MSTVFFISDTHFGHKNIADKYRTHFTNREEHDDTILKNILDTVTKRDTLWMLGDTCFTINEMWRIREIANRVQTLNFIPGNHCTDNQERLAIYKQFLAEDLFKKTGSMFKYKEFWLTHPPIHSEELRGKMNIHGHTHFHVMGGEHGVPDKRYINVSCEQINYTPISFDEIRQRN